MGCDADGEGRLASPGFDLAFEAADTEGKATSSPSRVCVVSPVLYSSFPETFS